MAGNERRAQVVQPADYNPVRLTQELLGRNDPVIIINKTSPITAVPVPGSGATILWSSFHFLNGTIV
jgi:hypothetical protein